MHERCWGSYLGQVFFFTLIAYVDPALIGYLDVRQLVSRILRTWRRRGVVDNVSYVQGPAQPLVIIHHPHISTASLSKGWGFRGMYRPTCLAASTLSPWVLLGRRGAWAPCIYKVYLVYRELWHWVQCTCPAAH